MAKETVARKFVVVRENHYGYDDFGYSVSGILGPFDSDDEAQKVADRLRAKDEYAMEYSVRELESE